MSMDINPSNVIPAPAPAPADDRTKQFIDMVFNVAQTVAAVTPIPQDDQIVQALKLIADQPWFLTMISKVIKTPHAQRAAMMSAPEELLK